MCTGQVTSKVGLMQHHGAVFCCRLVVMTGFNVWPVPGYQAGLVRSFSESEFLMFGHLLFFVCWILAGREQRSSLFGSRTQDTEKINSAPIRDGKLL